MTSSINQLNFIIVIFIISFLGILLVNSYKGKKQMPEDEDLINVLLIIKEFISISSFMDNILHKLQSLTLKYINQIQCISYLLILTGVIFPDKFMHIEKVEFINVCSASGLIIFAILRIITQDEIKVSLVKRFGILLLNIIDNKQYTTLYRISNTNI